MKKQAVELPAGFHQAVSERAHRIGGQTRGLTRYVWLVGAIHVLGLDDETLYAAAKLLREEFEVHGGDLSHLLDEGGSVVLIDVLRRVQPETLQTSKTKLRQIAQRIQQRQGSTRSKGLSV